MNEGEAGMLAREEGDAIPEVTSSAPTGTLQLPVEDAPADVRKAMKDGEFEFAVSNYIQQAINETPVGGEINSAMIFARLPDLIRGEGQREQNACRSKISAYLWNQKDKGRIRTKSRSLDGVYTYEVLVHYPVTWRKRPIPYTKPGYTSHAPQNFDPAPRTETRMKRVGSKMHWAKLGNVGKHELVHASRLAVLKQRAQALANDAVELAASIEKALNREDVIAGATVKELMDALAKKVNPAS